MAKSLAYSVLSVLLPAAVYAVVYLSGMAPDRLDHGYVYVPLLIADGIGIPLSVLALAGSNRIPMDISRNMRLTVLFAAMGIFLNIIGIEYVLGNTVFHGVTFPPAG